jgi:hypothetical protein
MLVSLLSERFPPNNIALLITIADTDHCAADFI